MSTLMTLLSALALVGEVSGGDATATVVHVYSPEAYTIRFTTADGTSCVTPHKWTPRRDPVKVNDTFSVHYSKLSPCDNVERKGNFFAAYGAFLLAPLFLALGLVELRRLRKRS